MIEGGGGVEELLVHRLESAGLIRRDGRATCRVVSSMPGTSGSASVPAPESSVLVAGGAVQAGGGLYRARCRS